MTLFIIGFFIGGILTIPIIKRDMKKEKRITDLERKVYQLEFQLQSKNNE